MPLNLTATTDKFSAIPSAQYAIHSVPVQHSRAFLSSIREVLPQSVPIISVSKGMELATGKMMSDLIPDALCRKQPTVLVSGPSFAKEIMEMRPTSVVAASRYS